VAPVGPRASAEAASPTPPPAEKPAKPPAKRSETRAETPGLSLRISAPVEVEKGGEGEIEIYADAKDPYVLDPADPMEVKLGAEPSGSLTFQGDKVSRSQGTFDKTTGRYKIPFRGATAGAAKAMLTVSLSLCHGRACLSKRAAVPVDIVVK
jgi:hypothetical protein